MREYISLECPDCSNRNYRTQKEMRGGQKLAIKKFCPYCRKHTEHKEKKK